MWFQFIRFGFFILLSASLTACQKPAEQNQTDRYPWQITILPDGSTRIFGIQPGLTSVRDGRLIIDSRQEPEIALFENPDGKLSLELFYKEFTRAGLSSRLVLVVMADATELQSLKQSATQKSKLESGTFKYQLNESALRQLETWPISAMTYIPHANLDEATISKRFGEPAQKIRADEQTQHWLYPEQGLDVIVNEADQEILQYVPPADFEALKALIKSNPDDNKAEK